MPKKKSKSPVFNVGTMGQGPYNRISHPRAYGAWLSMMQRCYNPKHLAYKYAEGSGMHVCDEWLDFQSFAAWHEAHDYVPEGSAGAVLTRIMGGEAFGPDTCLLVPRELLPALRVASRPHRGILGGVNAAAGHKYAAMAARGGRKDRYEARDTQEEARADYLEARAGTLEAEAMRLDAMLTDEIRDAAARRCAQLRAEADAIRAEGIRAKAERHAAFEAKLRTLRQRAEGARTQG